MKEEMNKWKNPPIIATIEEQDSTIMSLKKQILESVNKIDYNKILAANVKQEAEIL